MVNKVAVITGASGSLGKELVNNYLKKNYEVIALFNGNKINDCDRLKCFSHDLSKEQSFDDVFNYLDSICNSFTSLEIVHCAGIHDKCSIEDYSDDDFEKYIKVHCTSFINLYKSILSIIKRVMITNIVLISTNLLKKKNSGSIYYVTSKGMLSSVAKQIAYEYGKYNVLINCFLLGIFKSNMNKDMSEEKIKSIEEKIPIKRIGTKEEIAGFISTFTSINTLITGEEIVMDGGNTIGY